MAAELWSEVGMLSMEDLKEIGVNKLLHRKKIVRPLRLLLRVRKCQQYDCVRCQKSEVMAEL